MPGDGGKRQDSHGTCTCMLCVGICTNTRVFGYIRTHVMYVRMRMRARAKTQAPYSYKLTHKHTHTDRRTHIQMLTYAHIHTQYTHALLLTNLPRHVYADRSTHVRRPLQHHAPRIPNVVKHSKPLRHWMLLQLADAGHSRRRRR